MTNPIIEKLVDECRQSYKGILQESVIENMCMKYRNALYFAYTAGMERARELLPKEKEHNIDDKFQSSGHETQIMMDVGFNSCRSTAQQAISKEITEKT